MRDAAEMRLRLLGLFKKKYPDEYIESESEKILFSIFAKMESVTNFEQLNVSVSIPRYEHELLLKTVVENVTTVLRDMGYHVNFSKEAFAIRVSWSVKA